MKRPNLLFVFPDQWRKNAVGMRNDDPVYTPHIDKFAAQSVDLTNAISCFPLCSPNRSAMLTGRFPLSTGVTTNCKLGLQVKLNDDEVTIGNILKKEGYRTGYIGKWHLDLPETSIDPEPISGAVHWDAYVPPGPRRFGFDFWYSYNAYDRHMSPHYWGDSHEKLEPNEWSTKHETDVAIRFIKEEEHNQPFCLFVSWNPPHQPFEEVPDAYKALYADKPIHVRSNVNEDGIEQTNLHMREYFAAVTGTDQEFGRLMAALDETGLTEDTIVVLTSDHGETMGAHGWLEHKNIWYEESIGVPCFIRYPRTLVSHSDSLLFNSTDLVPTLLGLMGVAVPAYVQGTDYSRVLCGESGKRPVSAFICHYPGDVNLHKKAKAEGWDINAYGWRGVRTIRYTYVAQRKAVGDGRLTRLLYDNEMDPYQLSPLVYEGAPKNTIALELEKELVSWLLKVGDNFSLN
ncbi:sulfatase-like hydrolase/transferase [Paenibacillus sp. LMG 31458]|uniref:Sulfatase-like hydrolase/transferase n=1 Tax=Paenibacillus phytorum TaxID=2654977 RepID=A0ABX1Y3Q2_9BACL|nr:sulfatase [Paenibacillus phytorum]NOU75493.1 sulfatase-like hydrolase/transferase [Paenibacillus phytorum]